MHKVESFEMDIEQFRANAHQLVDWMASYLNEVRKYPVKPKVTPGTVKSQMEASAPELSESFSQIMSDFEDIVMPNIVHWQHPGFMAYFPANSSPPSVLAEMLTATLANQCMMWETSPAAAELEEVMMEWLKDFLGLPHEWEGVIQDTASTATLCAIISARERISDWQINSSGFPKQKLRVYASAETHSSIEKAVKIAGIGADNLVKISADDTFSMDAEKLLTAIKSDLHEGYLPTCVVATMGTTGVGACDPVQEIGVICRKYKIWLHIDAAFAGTALALSEFRWMSEGLELADSFVFNPHKWMFTNFDCTAYFVQNRSVLLETFSILPEYLKTDLEAQVNNYRDWGIPLGRRFRALKLWFVLRMMGKSGIRKKLRNHISWATEFARFIQQHPDLEIVAPRLFNLVCFRARPKMSDINLNDFNKQLLAKINESGLFYLTHTKIGDQFVIRAVFGQTYLEQEDVSRLCILINTILER